MMTHPIIISLAVLIMLAQQKYEIVSHPLAASRYSNIAVTLIEQSHVIVVCYNKKPNKLYSRLKIINLNIK